LQVKINSLGKKLIFWGIVLFFLGLLQGALVQTFHKAAVQSGMAMMIFGFIIDSLCLTKSFKKVTYYTNITGMYFIWFGITLSAILGASKALPIAGKGFSATSSIEGAIEILIITGAVASIVSVGLVLAGLFKKLNEPEE